MYSAGSSTSSVSPRKEKEKLKRNLKRKREEEEKSCNLEISTEMCPLWETTHNLNALVDHVFDFVKKKVDGGRTTNVYFLEAEWQTIAEKIDPLPPRYCGGCNKSDHKLTGNQVSSKVAALKISGISNKDLANMYSNDPVRKVKWEFILSRTERKSFSGGTSSRSRSGDKRKTRDQNGEFAEAVEVLVKLGVEGKITDSVLGNINAMMLTEETTFVDRLCIMLLSGLSHDQLAAILKRTLANKMGNENVGESQE